MKLPKITGVIVVAVLVISFGASIVLNRMTFSTTFSVCPHTEYCNSVYFSGKDNHKTIQYTGFPYHIKVGNPDWCTEGHDGICEGGAYHPDYEWQYHVYNMALVMLPSVLLVSAFVLKAYPRKFRHVVIIIAVLMCCLGLGWITNDFVLLHSVRGAGLHDPLSGKPIISGFPYSIPLSDGSSCTIATSAVSELKTCVDEAVNYGSFWNKSSVVIYVDWICYSGAYLIIAVLAQALKNRLHIKSRVMP